MGLAHRYRPHQIAGICLIAALCAAAPASAEGDSPFYSSYSSQSFDNNYARYKNTQGTSTNFVNDLIPLSTFGNDGRLKFESRDVSTTGTSATQFEGAQTGLQLDFKF